MGLPGSLLNFTSPILDRAVKTGGWGRTIKKTDYGVVGDAMFKKAQLDLGIANLQADMGIKQAELLSGLEMNKAQLDLEKANSLMEYSLKFRELEEQNDVGFFEGLFGTIAGAAEGAVAGFIMGGPAGAVAGGVAGGAATGVGYAAEGRKGGNAARNMIGAVASGAQLINQIGQQRKSEDGWQSILQTGADLISRMNSGDNSPKGARGRLEAMDAWQGHLSNLYNYQVSTGMNPQQAASSVKSYDQVMRGDMDPEEARSMRRSLEFAAEENPDMQSTMKFWADQSVNYARENGGKEIPDSLLSSMTESAHPGLMRSLGMSPSGEASSQVPVQAQTPLVRRDLLEAPAMVSGNMPDSVPQEPSLFGNPRQGRPIQQHAPAVTPPVAQQPGRVWHPPMVQGPAVAMDDGGSPPAQAEQELAKQGADAVDTLGERILYGGKVGGVGVPGLVSDKGVRQDEENALDEKIASQGTKQANKRMSLLSPEEALGVKLPPGANEQDVKTLVQKKAQGIESFADRMLRGTEQNAKTAGPQNRITAARDAANDIRRMVEVMDSMPDGKVKRFLADAAAEGKSKDALEFLAMAGIMGGASIATKGAAKGAVAAAGKIPGAQQVFDVATKLGDSLLGKLGISIGGGKAFGKMVPQMAQELLDDKTKDAVTELRALSRDLPSEMISASRTASRDTALELEKDYREQMPDFLDDSRTRYRKALYLLNSLESSITNTSKTYGGEAATPESKGNKVDGAKSKKDDLDIEFKRMRNARLQQNMAEEEEKRKKKSGGWTKYLNR